jgi:DNA-binding NarL/FixJ family response regulator
MESKISILIAEKQELLRKSLSSYLNTKGNFTVVSEANSTKSILEALKQFYVDLILLDSDIPIREGYGLFETCKRRFPELKIVLITNETDMRIVSEFMAKGAAGCLNKNCTIETLCAALRTVHTEGYYFDNACSKALLDSLLKPARP